MLYFYSYTQRSLAREYYNHRQCFNLTVIIIFRIISGLSVF
ncbi:hypothetical protein CRENPOLYSF1_150033 [Crenothrix polyspora]|uniref:Uncharacterized protein n=1 Tax=Crenothrix polyspora TaxID=360316 RepID=A0A1R4H2T1_9GAMM|nr:hypothetical protein CRENPOLYSF1_150033 [Crenothrix polyspora]